MQVTDGERLPLAVKELGSCDLYPQVNVYLCYFNFGHGFLEIFVLVYELLSESVTCMLCDSCRA